jgi:hypothetical protein
MNTISKVKTNLLRHRSIRVKTADLSRSNLDAIIQRSQESLSHCRADKDLLQIEINQLV